MTYQPKFVLGITHAAHIPERRPMLQRLLDELQAQPGPEQLVTHVETTRGPFWVWASLMWEKTYELAMKHGATDVLFLQDDDEVSPVFWRALEAMCVARPDEIIALDCQHPHARTVFMRGDCGYTTIDGLVGLGYRWRVGEDVGQFGHFLRWQHEALREGSYRKITEDSLQGVYAVAHGLRFFHPVPTIIDHDLEAPSACSNDDHMYRRPQVTWRDVARAPELPRMLEPEWWGREVPHLGRFYTVLHQHLPLVMLDTALATQRMLAAEKDACPAWAKKYFHNLRSV